MTINKELFGTVTDGEVYLYTLKNNNGLEIKVMNFGATITSITVPGKNGKRVSLACGFDNFDDYFSEEYQNNAPYFGCTVGRYCSQIKDAKFTLDGKSYELAKNCGPNNLHGGSVGFDKKIWNAQALENENGVLFSLRSKHLEEGFPGNADVSVLIKLTDNNEIVLNYEATSDKTTPFSMTNHTYFNLSGFERNVEDFVVKINTDQLLELDETGAATGTVKNVGGTTEDLQNGRKIKDVHLALNEGFEHFYVFNNSGQELREVAVISDEQSGRKLQVFSCEPCMLFYTGKYTSDNLQRNEKEKFGKFRGFCCETHRWPNGPNINHAPNSFLHPNEKFSTKTIFKISF